MYTVRDEVKNTLEVYDDERSLVGKAIFDPHLSSDLYEKPRIDIYINIITNDIKVKDYIFDELMRRSRKVKEDNKDKDVRVYHCCFSYDKESIDYYSTKKGFIHDEGMYIIRRIISESSFQVNKINSIEFAELDLVTEEEIRELVEKQNQIFIHGYSCEDLRKLKSQGRSFSIGAKHEGEIVGNIVVVIKEDCGSPYGWIDDLFVDRQWRKQGIGKNLLNLALDKLRTLEIKESRLEVWSANKRALSVYNNVGYEFYEEKESSIGMFL